MPARPALLTQRYIFRFWLPLAFMWLMMAVEQPLLAGVIARMADAKEQLAAFGVTFALALLTESPIIMLLAASTALAKGRQSYGQLLRFTTVLSLALTLLHLALGLTPAYGIIVGVVIDAPPQLIEPSRQAFLVMFPWSAAVAYRRLWQGVLIRFGKTDQVGLTTVIRLSATAFVALGGMAWGVLPGATLAGLSLSAGVIAGAITARVLVHPLVRRELRQPEAAADRISLAFLLQFYIPLALTNMINFIGQPLLTLGLSRALLPLESLALWPVLMSLAFLFRSGGFAYQEVVIALAEYEKGGAALLRFALFFALLSSVALFLLAITPLNGLWHGRVAGLTPDLVALAHTPTLLISLSPAAAFLVSWQRGVLMHQRRTRIITLAVAIHLVVLIAGMWIGLLLFPLPGAVLAAAALMLALIVETLFLFTQTRSARRLAQPGPAPA